MKGIDEGAFPMVNGGISTSAVRITPPTRPHIGVSRGRNDDAAGGAAVVYGTEWSALQGVRRWIWPQGASARGGKRVGTWGGTICLKAVRVCGDAPSGGELAREARSRGREGLNPSLDVRLDRGEVAGEEQALGFRGNWRERGGDNLWQQGIRTNGRWEDFDCAPCRVCADPVTRSGQSAQREQGVQECRMDGRGKRLEDGSDLSRNGGARAELKSNICRGWSMIGDGGEWEQRGPKSCAAENSEGRQCPTNARANIRIGRRQIAEDAGRVLRRQRAVGESRGLALRLIEQGGKLWSARAEGGGYFSGCFERDQRFTRRRGQKKVQWTGFGGGGGTMVPEDFSSNRAGSRLERCGGGIGIPNVEVAEGVSKSNWRRASYCQRSVCLRSEYPSLKPEAVKSLKPGKKPDSEENPEAVHKPEAGA
ncbi:hypothetical protein DFH09DRAFT_1080192 [Mycena vulgaris]|nr:hypothetical protein DFH09DRAFT_1080192 [Mycena vulgaris]